MNNKCFVVIISCRTMMEIGFVYTKEEDVIVACDAINLEFSPSSSAKAYYLERDLR
jgi:hypothetical protein